MTETRKRRRGLIPALGLIAAIVLAPTAFKLFEPMLVYRLGWTPLPADAPWPAIQEVLDPAQADHARAAEAALEAARRKMGTPAISAAVSIDGKTVWRSAVGYADLEARRPVGLGDRFRLGSTSKAVTSLAVGTLVDRGLIALDAPIQRYVPSYPAKPWPITVREVMSHRAGIRDYGLCFCFPIWEHLSTRHFDSVTDSISVIAGSPLIVQPGTAFRYSSLGYNLAGAAVEQVSGIPFGQYLGEAVFKPLGMTSSGLDAVAGAERSRVSFYEVEAGRFKRAWPVDNSIRWPSGGILSTPSDMVLLGGALLDDRLLTAATRQALLTVPIEGGQSRGGRVYALGWRVGTWSLFGGALKLHAFHHAGTAVGSTSVLVVFPERRMVVSLMMNKGGDNADDLGDATDRVAEAFIGGAR